MKKASLSFSLAAALLLAIAPALVAQGRGNGQGNQNQNPIRNEPVLVYQVSGGFVTGPVETVLTVYNNGLAVLAVQDATAPEGKMCTADIPQDSLRELLQDLRQAGALRLRDEATVVPDVPRTTVTVFAYRGNSGRAISNTFSYFVPEGQQSAVEDTIAAFIAEFFAGC